MNSTTFVVLSGIIATTFLIVSVLLTIRLRSVRSNPRPSEIETSEFKESANLTHSNSGWDVSNVNSKPLGMFNDPSPKVPLNGTNEIVINRIRLDYMATIAHGITSFSKTRNIKTLGAVGRKLRSDYTWIEIYFLEHGFMDTGLNKLYIALEALEHTTQHHLDDAVTEVISLATYTETILEELAVKLSVSPWISGGVINRLVNESD